MKIKWYAHACFRIEGDGLSIICDPYTPEKSGFAPVTEPADIVIRCSHEDSAHGNAGMIPGNPEVVTTTWIGGETTVQGLHITAIPAMESRAHKRAPREHCMYTFTLEGMRVTHFGDVGEPLRADQLVPMAGTDIAIVPTGGLPTIELIDLYDALQRLKPRIIIPMHYDLPGCKFPKMLPVTDFTNLFPQDAVIWADDREVKLTRAALPSEPRVMVLQATTAQPT